MRVIAVINYKGGTGKTCLTVNLGHGLALAGKKVLIIDTDPQGSVFSHLGLTNSNTLYDVLMGTETWSDCVVNARENLDVIGSNHRLYTAEMKMAKHKSKEFYLSNRLTSLSGYDYVLLDCAPTINLINQNVLLFSDEIMIPVSMDYLSLVGVKQLLQNMKVLRKIFDKELQVSMVVPTFYDLRNKKTKSIMDSLNRVFPNRISSPIRVSVAFSEAPAAKKTIWEHTHVYSKGVKDYNKLIEEVCA